jgi:16S rRNA (cytosine967-C5)-methyltransferase
MVRKIHRHLAEACVRTLEEILHAGAAADRAVSAALGEHRQWGSRDRAFFADTVYEVVRWRRRLAHLAESEALWALAGLHWMRRGLPRPEWAPWPDISAEALAAREVSLTTAPRAVRESLSDELDALGAADPWWDAELAALNAPAPVFLRVNPQRASLPDVIRALAAAAIAAVEVPGAPLALRVDRTLPPRLVQSGHFEIQDAGSQQVAPFVRAENGQTVLDVCAGAGGKTLHLAALTPRCELHAFDTVPGKLSTLRRRAARAGVRVQTHEASPEVFSRFHAEAHRALVDAPCTGTGTLRRHPELKYRITAATLAETVALQREILTRSARLVRPGGRLVYATCSLLSAENEQQAAWFSAQHPDFSLEEERRLSCAATGWDGFYMARWQKQ